MQSWWAILLYVIAFLGLAYAGFRFARYRIRMKHEIRLSHFEQQQIEELNRVKLQFFTNVTHELMTPLSILITSLEGLNKGVGEPHALYSVMTVNAARLMRLIQQILEFRKAESGNLKLGVSQGDIAAFIRKCSEAFTPLVTKKALHFSFEALPRAFGDGLTLTRSIRSFITCFRTLPNTRQQTDGSESRSPASTTRSKSRLRIAES